MKLTEKQKRFVEEYLIDLNATQAYMRAGYKAKNDNIAGVEAFKLLRNPKIEAAVQEAKDKRSKRTEITADRVLQEYAKIVFANITDYLKVTTGEKVVAYNNDGDPVIDVVQSVQFFDTEDIDKSKLDAVAEFKQGRYGLEMKLHDKKGALDSIARHLGMFTDKLEHTGSVQIENKYSYMGDEERKKAITKLQGMMKNDS